MDQTYDLQSYKSNQHNKIQTQHHSQSLASQSEKEGNKINFSLKMRFYCLILTLNGWVHYVQRTKTSVHSY